MFSYLFKSSSEGSVSIDTGLISSLTLPVVFDNLSATTGSLCIDEKSLISLRDSLHDEIQKLLELRPSGTEQLPDLRLEEVEIFSKVMLLDRFSSLDRKIDWLNVLYEFITANLKNESLVEVRKEKRVKVSRK